MEYRLVCTKCDKVANARAFRCGRCGAILEVEYDYSTLHLPAGFRKMKPSSTKYVCFFPINELMFSEGEGATPLVSRNVGSQKVLIKLETKNPTRSFKDRGSVLEMGKLLELGLDSVCCASTGNMGMSVAHYAKRSGVKATIFISKDADRRKISIIKKSGARLVRVDGDFNTALNQAEAFARETGAIVCGDYHYRKEGQKTVMFEIIDQLKYKVPDFVFVPVGNATLLAAVHKALLEYRRAGLIRKFPRIVAVQSERCSPLVRAYNAKKEIRYMRPNTVADAIAVGYPTFGFEGVDTLKATKGLAVAVSEKEIMIAVRKLREMKVNSEPGGAAGFAGFLKMQGSNKDLFRGKTVVVAVTGNN